MIHWSKYTCFAAKRGEVSTPSVLSVSCPICQKHEEFVTSLIAVCRHYQRKVEQVEAYVNRILVLSSPGSETELAILTLEDVHIIARQALGIRSDYEEG